MAAVFGATGKFSNWTGTMRFSGEGAQLYLAFSPDCANAPQAIEFATAHAAALRSFPDSSTVLTLHSPIAAALRGGEENLRVRVSGCVFPMRRSGFATAPANPAGQGSARQRYRGETPNAPASVAHPRYLAKFDSVEPGR